MQERCCAWHLKHTFLRTNCGKYPVLFRGEENPHVVTPTTSLLHYFYDYDINTEEDNSTVQVKLIVLLWMKTVTKAISGWSVYQSKTKCQKKEILFIVTKQMLFRALLQARYFPTTLQGGLSVL